MFGKGSLLGQEVDLGHFKDSGPFAIADIDFLKLQTIFIVR